MASSTASTSSASPTPSSNGGRVSLLRQNWALQEDCAFAERLQNQEIVSHYDGNKQRNSQIRQDFPTALQEQTAEATRAEQILERQRKIAREQEDRDKEVARSMAEELEQVDKEHRRYEATRDELFAKKIQALEVRKQRQQQRAPPPAEGVYGAISRKPILAQRDSGTPPLPVMANGDVPTATAGATAVVDTSFHDLRGGIRYNDDQYLVKTAFPATVVDREPVYANNKPEHYAVSIPYPSAGAAEATGGRVECSELLGAAGLSQRDLALSKRAELQLEQERRDKQLAERLQAQLEASPDDEEDLLRTQREAGDLELAKSLHAKEKAKLKRAKERSRLKKQQLHQEVELVQHHSRQHSETDSRAGSRLSDGGRRSNLENPPLIDLDESLHVSLPARRPYMNREVLETRDFTSSKEEIAEPQYENLPPKGAAAAAAAAMVPVPRPRSRAEAMAAKDITTANDDTPVPPYMPMQQSASRKSSSMEKRINRKKEKEGCKQQ